MPKRALLFYFSCLSAFMCYAQQHARFLHYSVKDGLSQNSVHAIFRDRDGLVWIGTQDGLNSFDGKNFKVYRHNDNDTNTISDQFVVCIKEDKKGYIWIGTRNGLNRLDKHTGIFKRFYIDESEKHSFQAAYFEFFLQDDSKALVIRNGKAAVIDPENGGIVLITSPADPRCTWMIRPDYRATVIDTRGKGYKTQDLRQKIFTPIASTDAAVIKDVQDLSVKLLKDTVYLLSRGDAKLIYRYDLIAGNWLQPVSSPVPIIHLTASENELYISSHKGICKISSGEADFISNDPGNNNSLPPGNILCTYIDNEGNLWAGTAGNGLAVNSRSFENYLLIKPVVPNDVITCLKKIDDVVYAGSRSGIYRIALHERGESQKFIPLLKGKSVTALTIDAQRKLWAGIEGEGIYVMDLNGSIERKFTPGNSVLTTTSIMNLNTAAGGRILVSTTAGFFTVESAEGKWAAFSATSDTHKVRGNYIMSSFADRTGNIWISNNFGLDIIDSQLRNVQSYNSDNDSSSAIKRTIITGVTEDKNGDKWIGTIRNGIYKLSGNKFTHFTSAQGLSSDVVYNAVCDSRNRIWATTSTGLNVFDKSQNAFTALGVPDGVPAGAFVFGAMEKDADGNILMGTSEGLLICRADNVALHMTKIRVVISDIKVNGQSLPVTSSFKIIPDNKLIDFTFTSSPAFFSGNIIYQYRLTGLQEDWISLPPGVHTISYTGLPYKELQLQVRAATATGNLEGAPITSMLIKSKAPYWKTPLFIAGSFVLFLIVIALIIVDVNKKKYQKKLAKIQLEKELQGERVRIGRDLHDNIGAYTSALIAGLNHIKPADEKQATQVEDLKDYGINIMGFLRETIWMLNTEILTITAFADRFKNYAMRISSNYPGINLVFRESIEANVSPPPARMLNIFRILQEALQNAYKHAQADEIIIHIESKRTLCFRVEDNGKGFLPKENSEGYGVANMQQRAKDSGFELQIISTPKGTWVELKEIQQMLH